MDKSKIRKLNIILYSIGVLASIFALYTFFFVIETGIIWRITLIIIALGWLLSAVFELLKNYKK